MTVMRTRSRHAVKPWSHPTLEDVPRDLTGVYAFWYRRTGRCVYVGQAAEQTIRERLMQHWRRSHNEMLNLWMKAYRNSLDVCYAPVEKRRIATMERRLIRRWKPETNVQHNR